LLLKTHLEEGVKLPLQTPDCQHYVVVVRHVSSQS
jgi:hypothetical protein